MKKPNEKNDSMNNTIDEHAKKKYVILLVSDMFFT